MEHEHHTDTNANTNTPQENEKQCRICFDGEDPELGRLIRPCLCKGSVSYVHVKCLHRWRTSSRTQGAFYRCPQCGYHYRFARTKVMGIASNPIVVGILSCFAFTLLLFCSSFVTTYLISGTSDDSYFFVYPWDTFREVMRSVACAITDIPCDDRNVSARARRMGERMRGQRPTLLNRFVRRLLLGLPTVGAGSVLNMIWSLPFPIHSWIRMRLRRGSRSTSDLATLIFLAAIIIGAARALFKVYQLTEKAVKRILLRAEDAILEVS
ncbi:hypothetical protein NM688_g4698 [Phlebia brevispora]|uniref:Uncharacterized protein n=1 Tax=Phlebia brevispora TaxID=194682 RepID=A0ACC1T1W5_9APHY|nr:hypothetical protein NM688_g4698 [Phlebia brevispora]